MDEIRRTRLTQDTKYTLIPRNIATIICIIVESYIASRVLSIICVVSSYIITISLKPKRNHFTVLKKEERKENKKKEGKRNGPS